MRLKHFSIILFALIAILPLAVLGIWLQNSMIKYEVESVTDRHLLIARNVGNTLEQYHRNTTSVFSVVADRLVHNEPVDSFKAVLELLKFQHICLIDEKSGSVLRKITTFNTSKAGGMPPEALAFARAQAAEAAMPAFSRVYAGRDGASVMYLAKRIGGKLALGAISTEFFVSTGNAVKFGDKGHAAIVDHEGNVLAHPLPSWIAARKNIVKVSAVQKMLRGETGIDIFFSPALKDDMIAGYTGIKGPGWGIMVPQPMRELVAAANRERDAILFVVLLGLLGAMTLALAVSHLLARPIEALAASAGTIAGGRVSARVKENDGWYMPSELKKLQTSFNHMAEAIQRYQAGQVERRKHAERLSSSKSRYLAGLAHELKTPLNSILGFAGIMRMEQFGPLGSSRYTEFLRDIERGGGHLLDLVNSLLDYTRIEQGAVKLQEDVFNLDECLERCRTLPASVPGHDARDIRITMPEPQIMVHADERAMDQMLQHLVSNAVRYTGTGGRIEVFTRLLESGVAEITVSDNGIGIAPEDLDRVTEPFHRSDRQEVAVAQGNGLGLAIVAGLARLHEMSLSIESSTDWGTKVTLTIPRFRVNPKVAARQARLSA